jgi:hypothetical protein
MNPGGQLVVSDNYPNNAKTKCVYLIWKEPASYPRDDQTFRDNLIYGDLSQQPLEHLVTFIEDVSFSFEPGQVFTYIFFMSTFLSFY